MTTRTLLLSLIAGAICVSCGPNAQQGAGGGQARRDTLAGAADTTKKQSRSADREVRLPQAPISSASSAAATSSDPTAGFGARTTSPPPPPAAPTPAAAAAAQPNAADIADVPLAPKEAQWTIYCATLGGPDHMATAKALKKSLIQRTGMREWYLVHEAGQSRLYYGYYRSIGDPADPVESARAKADRLKVDELVDGGGERPFRECQFVQLDAPDPESPPEWDITNTPPEKVWTLIVAAYKDHPDRKQAAVESVRDARARGEEAYFFHGPNVSNVCVGAWTEEAVAEERVDAKEGVRAQDPLLVLPPGMKVDGRVRKNGEAVRAVGQQLVPVDPVLKAKIEQYPQMGVNGNLLIIKKNGRQRVQGTMIAAIPRPAQELFGGPMGDEGDAAAAAAASDDPFGELRAPRRRGLAGRGRAGCRPAVRPAGGG